jgi:multiple sugar transport system ATP-binding protein
MAEIKLVDLCKRYENGFTAVNQINLQIADGELLVLVGPSGCGKSTTLRMIAGLEDVSSGDIYLGQRRINTLEPGDRDIAMVFQNYALYPHMTVRENLSFGLRMRRTPKAEIEKRVQHVASILSLETLLDRRPKQLSGGQRQRVAVGRAIVRQPQAFLFDEPLSNLDAKLRVQMRTELARLHQQLKTTTVYVTHDQVEAMTLGDRIVVMKDGLIQQVDTPMNVYSFPANLFVAGFIGSPAMNFLQGTIEDGIFRSGSLQYPLGRQSGTKHESKNNSANQAPNEIKGAQPEDSTSWPSRAILGFRPEGLTLQPQGPPLATVTLDVVEQMGHETVLYFQFPEDSQPNRSAIESGSSGKTTGGVARLAGQIPLHPGDQIDLYLPLDQWHLFSSVPNALGQQTRYSL